MRILITGAAGFLGSQLARFLREEIPDASLVGVDNLSRKGAQYNIPLLEKLHVLFLKGDITDKQFVESLECVDWVIDCAAEPSVLAGLGSDSFSIVNNNLIATLYLLEKCKRDNAGFILPSTSRVYSIEALNKLQLKVKEECFIWDNSQKDTPSGFSQNGVSEIFSTDAPISVYGATKLASEVMALEYHKTFGFPVWINRCGVIAGAGQFGKIDQGIFSFWIYQYLLKRPLSFIGYGGNGYQARDILHPRDLGKLILQQMTQGPRNDYRVFNAGGGLRNTMSLSQLNYYCTERLKTEKVIGRIAENRQMDVPLYYSDNSRVTACWSWTPEYSALDILDEILEFTKHNPQFLEAIA
jgi:CDP-paratose 2-epimerase